MLKSAAFLVLAFAAAALARDDKFMMPLKSILESKDFKDKVGSDIKFVFGDTAIPAGAASLGEVKTNKKTNSVGKSDSAGCEWVFLGAMKAIAAKARSVGATSVVGLQSNYKNVPYSSTTDYECHVGTVVSGVALKGVMIKEAK